jgi:hypothetical protein
VGQGTKGNVTRVVRHEEGTEEYTAHRIDYGINGEVVLYVLGESWEWDGEAENCPTDYAVSYAREFRYDNAMQRYMNVELDPTDDFEPIETVWTDYDLSAGQAGLSAGQADGDRVYGDFEVVDDEYLEVMSHDPGGWSGEGAWTAQVGTGGGRGGGPDAGPPTPTPVIGLTFAPVCRRGSPGLVAGGPRRVAGSEQ